MTPNEIQMLCVGVALGVELTVIVRAASSWRQNRRHARRNDPPEPRVEQPVRHTENHRDKHTGPHHGELVQAEIRDFHLRLLDLLDQFEDQAKREGLL